MKRQTTLWLAAGFLLVANTLLARTVPVFRHALEQWPAREVYLTVGLAQTPSLRDRNLMRTFETNSLDQRGPCNYRMRLEYRQVSSYITIAGLNPDVEDVAPFFTGELTEATLKRVLRSPLRDNIASELLAGKASVWLFIEGKTPLPKVRAKIAATLAAESKRLTLHNKKAAGETDETTPQTEQPLPVDFVLHTLGQTPATEKAEAILLGQLADLSPGMTVPAGSLFCVTGRGLIIASFGPETITTDNLTAVCEFLAAPYSCDLNHLKNAPALLLKGDWGKIVPLIVTEIQPTPATGLPTSVPEGSQAGKDDLPKLPAAPVAPSPKTLPPTPPAPKKTLIDKIPFLYIVGAAMAGWIGFMLYRLKQEYDSHQRTKKEEESQK